jgi:pimeloyl-ACP methyl ester carboxylesterase/DNA-binding CsgD family transcriptional regulator
MSQLAQEIRFCTSRDGVRIAYATCGAGPPLIWIGHWVRHLNFDWESPIWRPWLSLLSSRHCVIRYDWRGCGLSDRDVEFSLEKHVEDLEAVVEATALQHFVLVAEAGGGVVSIVYAARHPERVTRLVLYGTQTRGALVRRDTKRVQEGRAFVEVMKVGWHSDTPAYGKFFTALHMPDASAEQLRSYGDLLRLTTSPENAAALVQAYFEADALDAVARVRCPTLVLHAREDAIIPFEEGRLVAALIPNARFVPLESRNHILQEREPAWQHMVSEVEAFLPVNSNDSRGFSVATLTPRERDVLELIARGLDNYRIAKQLGISEKTVRNHASMVFDKIGANSRAQAVALARDAGLGRDHIVRAEKPISWEP